MGEKLKMLTPRQFAARVGVAYTTVANWLQQGIIPEAIKRETPSGHYWEVPETATVPQLKVGRPKKSPAPAIQEPKKEAA